MSITLLFAVGLAAEQVWWKRIARWLGNDWFNERLDGRLNQSSSLAASGARADSFDDLEDIEATDDDIGRMAPLATEAWRLAKLDSDWSRVSAIALVLLVLVDKTRSTLELDRACVIPTAPGGGLLFNRAVPSLGFGGKTVGFGPITLRTGSLGLAFAGGAAAAAASAGVDVCCCCCCCCSGIMLFVTVLCWLVIRGLEEWSGDRLAAMSSCSTSW